MSRASKRKERKLADALRMVRHGAKLTAQELADGLYVDRSVVCRIETGVADCPTELLLRWLQICGGKAMCGWVISTFQSLMAMCDFPDHVQLA